MPRAAKLRAEGSPQRQVPNGASVSAHSGGEREKEEEEVSLTLGGDWGGLTCHQTLIISSRVLTAWEPSTGRLSSLPSTVFLRGK